MKPTSRRLMLMVTIAAAATFAEVPLVSTAEERDREQAIALEQLPAAVRAAVEHHCRRVDHAEIEKKASNGQTVYEVSMRKNDIEMELLFDEQGNVVGLEFDEADDDDGDADDDADDHAEESDPGVLEKMEKAPAAARRALKELAGSAQITGFEAEREGDAMLYEAAWREQRKAHEGKVTAAGDLIETEHAISLREAPAPVQKLAKKLGRRGAEVAIVRKDIVLYELETQVNGREMERLVTPLGQPVESNGSSRNGVERDD